MVETDVKRKNPDFVLAFERNAIQPELPAPLFPFGQVPKDAHLLGMLYPGHEEWLYAFYRKIANRGLVNRDPNSIERLKLWCRLQLGVVNDNDYYILKTSAAIAGYLNARGMIQLDRPVVIGTKAKILSYTTPINLWGNQVNLLYWPWPITDFYTLPGWKRLSRQVRDLCGHVCMKCGASLDAGAEIHTDHILSRFRKPEREMDPTNLQVLCSKCNMEKGAIDETDYRTDAQKRILYDLKQKMDEAEEARKERNRKEAVQAGRIICSCDGMLEPEDDDIVFEDAGADEDQPVGLIGITPTPSTPNKTYTAKYTGNLLTPAPSAPSKPMPYISPAPAAKREEAKESEQDSTWSKSCRKSVINNPWLPNPVDDELLESAIVAKDVAEAICRLRAALKIVGIDSNGERYDGNKLWDNKHIEEMHSHGKLTVRGIHTLVDFVSELEPMKEKENRYLDCAFLADNVTQCIRPSTTLVPVHLVYVMSDESGNKHLVARVYASVDGELMIDTITSSKASYTFSGAPSRRTPEALRCIEDNSKFIRGSVVHQAVDR